MLDIEKMISAVEEFKPEIKMPSVLNKAPVEIKLIILIDIVGFSKGTTIEQLYKIHLFQGYLRKSILSNKIGPFSEQIKIRHFVPTGDGCYIIADKCDTETALDFLVALVGGFQHIRTEEKLNLSLRASALFGECVPFLDMNHKFNFIGEGMNEAARILTYGQAALEKNYLQENPENGVFDSKLFSRNSLYTDESFSANLPAYKKHASGMYFFEQVSDKHGKTRSIWILQAIR